MALTLSNASPRGVSKPYVNAPGANATGAAAFTKAASTFYPDVYGGTTATGAATTTTPPAAATSSVDYNTLLANDPLLKQALANINAGGIGNQAQLQAGQQRALVQRGIVPTGNLPGVSSIDPTTAALAAQNTLAGTSTQAALTRAYQQATQTDNASLAARGMLRTGAFGQHAAEDLQNFNTAGYQADQATTDYLQGLYSGYLQQQQQLQGQAVTATGDASNRIFDLIKAGLLSGGAPSPPAPETPVQWGLPPGVSMPAFTPQQNTDLAAWVPPTARQIFGRSVAA